MAKQIAFNCVPQIDKFQDNGYTKEEMKMVWETRKILGDPNIRVNAYSGPRAGILRASPGSEHLETRNKITADGGSARCFQRLRE